MQNENTDCKDPIQLLLAPYAKYGEQLDNEKKQTVWLLEEYDQYFSKASRTILGVFSSKVNASLAMVDAYSGEERQFRKNGTDQWVSDVLSCGIMIREVELDKFEEL